ncbi:hypothetical protein SESBI_09694 [Sesbania bispinosa]|nr:hypothetical protein SESBI_09694 [Sesbania bispinosa]
MASSSTNPFNLPSPSSQLLPRMMASSSTNPQDVPAAAPPPAPANPSSSRFVQPCLAPSNEPSHVPSNNAPRNGKSETITPPFQWATDKRAILFSINDLLEKQIFTITGEVHCMGCKRNSEIGFDLKEKFIQVWNFIAENKSTMHDRAPRDWMSPKFPNCGHCGEQVRPVIASKKRSINWLFLFLGQMVSYCTLEQLKYFCKHTVKHRTGAKDRLVYTVYLEICRQLVPDGPFHP